MGRTIKRPTGSKRKQRIQGKNQKTRRRTPRISNANRTLDAKVHGKNLRTNQTIRRLNMYKSKVQRNKKGKIVYQEFQRRDTDKPMSRVQPDRRWFGNTRVIGQHELEHFRDEIGKAIDDPYSVVLRHKKLPMSLLSDSLKTTRMNILETQTFSETFGKNKTRKKPRLLVSSMEQLAKRAEQRRDIYESSDHEDSDMVKGEETFKDGGVEQVMLKGQSKRIRGEVLKVIDSSDVILQILDARDPAGTRSLHIEKYLKTECKHKHLVNVLNKVDLVPTWVTQRWMKILTSSAPTVAFHASITNSFGKGTLIQVLRQFAQLHPERQHVSVGLIGYPNVGKSSVINTLIKRKSCKVAPIPGETKVWQYITLFSKIYLIDCPGVVYPSKDTTAIDTVLRGVIRVETIKDPEDFVAPILEAVRPDYIRNTYGIRSWTDSTDFLTQLAVKRGKLQKGGKPDLHIVGRLLVHDWCRGQLPWFRPPPFEDDLRAMELEEAAKKEVATSRNELDMKEIECEPIPFIKPVFTFSEADANEKAFLSATKHGTPINFEGGPSAKDLAEITVANPLGLLEDDPLIVEAKLRVWKQKARAIPHCLRPPKAVFKQPTVEQTMDD